MLLSYYNNPFTKKYMKKNRTNAKPSQLWNFYQYILTLDLILNSEDWDILYIEEYWDVATVSEWNKSESIEAKHHIEHSTLGDKHIDFWKTLYNWCKDYDTYIKFWKLILHTTSILPNESNFKEWNNSNKEEKKIIVKEIIKTGSTATTKKFFDYVDEFDEDKLLSVLEKIVISSSNENIHLQISTLIKKNPYFKWLKNIDNREDLLSHLLGVLSMTYIKQKEIDIESFLSKVRPQKRKYMEFEYVIPKFKQKKVKKLIHKKKKFILELSKIWIDEFNLDNAIQQNIYFKDTFLSASKSLGFLNELEWNIIPEILRSVKLKKWKFHLAKNSYELFHDVIGDRNFIKSDYFESNKDFENWSVHENVERGEFTWLYN